ncbi:hypothetical protein SELMODRAFT_138083 [Selaginella moellendorffii]|uniref:Pentacotripeptide-repeat region of PRORP domain-containing protein n=1 Tax=Selaginella moellendorffii TaxID=88036 RepID=D8TEL6_SELML|nr:hypothetical protein SELMODRAFT_138083 [Selaginella moellendorffii]
MPERNLVAWNTLLAAYSKQGLVEEASELFDGMPERSLVSWTAMLVVLAGSGRVDDATRLFDAMPMRNSVPDAATLAMAIIAIASKSSNKGRSSPSCYCCRRFASMALDFGVAATKHHYSCLVGILARAGDVEDARDLVANMPFEPDEHEWTSLLVACRGQTEHQSLAARAANRLVSLTASSQASYPYLLWRRSALTLMGS